MIRRALGSLLALLSILILPYWIYVPVLFIAIILFPFFWEGILLGFLIDVIHGGGIESFPSLISPFALFAFIALIVLLPLRTRLRSYV